MVTKNEHIKLKGRKLAMYEALKKNLGVITAACKATGLSRQSHYRWMENDENYAYWVNSVDEETIEFAENALYKLIQSGNPAAVMFLLKTRGRSKGYIDKQEVEISGNSTTDFVKQMAIAYDEYKRDARAGKD